MPMESQKRLIIIDSSSLLYRAFHALPPLTSKTGQPTGAVYGFLLTLFKAMKDLQATHVVACFDTPKPTFRHEQFADYKATRLPPPDALILQFPLIKEVLKTLGIPLFEKEGFEADDLIATIAEKLKGSDVDIFIVSGDLDNLQLVNHHTKLYTLGKGIKDSVVYDEQKVVERFGVTPSQMNDFKALTGDNSDNIPGVPGIGKVAAADLIGRFGSIENLYAEMATDTAALKPKVKEALKQNKDNAFLSLHLVETKKDVELDFDLELCKFGNFDQGRVKDIFIELGFMSLMNNAVFKSFPKDSA